MTEQRNTKKLRVGDGITGYEREECLLDEEHRNSYIAGEPVKSELRRSPIRPFGDLRHEIETQCREVFSASGLPDPFLLLPTDSEREELPWSQVANRDHDFIRATLDTPYHLCALLHSPSEDHSDLWYAARLAVTLVELDITERRAAVGLTSPSETAVIAAHLGAEVGRLENEWRFKKANEARALLGQAAINGGAAGGRATAEKTRQRSRRIIAAMDRRVKNGQTISNAAKLTFEHDKLGSSADANRKVWSRHQDNIKKT